MASCYPKEVQGFVEQISSLLEEQAAALDPATRLAVVCTAAFSGLFTSPNGLLDCAAMADLCLARPPMHTAHTGLDSTPLVRNLNSLKECVKQSAIMLKSSTCGARCGR